MKQILHLNVADPAEVQMALENLGQRRDDPHLDGHGVAELHDAGGAAKFGPGWDEAWVRIVPQRVNTWGIEAPAFTEGSRSARSIPPT